MSMESKEIIKCPKCGYSQEFIVWKSLNGDLDPEAKQQLLDGTLFRFECTECGHRSDVVYEILYHDMKNRAMVYFTDEELVDLRISEMYDAEKKMGIIMPDYRKRVVTNQNSLREKAIIFEHGLDDRIVEILKLLFYISSEEQMTAANIREIYFLVADGEYILQFIGDKKMSTSISREMYESVERDFAEKLDIGCDNEALIDFDWAIKVIENSK